VINEWAADRTHTRSVIAAGVLVLAETRWSGELGVQLLAITTLFGTIGAPVLA
jgi:hypothetical protein